MRSAREVLKRIMFMADTAEMIKELAKWEAEIRKNQDVIRAEEALAMLKGT